MGNIGQTNVTPEKQGKNWTVRVRANGTRQRVNLCLLSETEGMSKVQRDSFLAAKLSEVLSSVNAGNNPNAKDTKPEHLTVSVAFDSWLQQSRTRRRNPIRANTDRLYSHYGTRWIKPVVGNSLLCELKSTQAKKVVDYMHKAKASDSVINDVVTIMQQVIESVKDADGQNLYTWRLDREVMDVPIAKPSPVKAFEGSQVSQIVARAQGQYRVLFALAAVTGARIGELLGIEIDADPEKVTTLSKDNRVLHVNTQVLQDGETGEAKTQAGVREVDIHPDVAKMLTAQIGNRESGYLFSTASGKPILYANLRKNVLDKILYDVTRPIMKREGKGWKQIGENVIPGVVGPQSTEGYGCHSFRRFRANHLDIEGAPVSFQHFWLGHGKKTITEEYQKSKQEVSKRREWAGKIGLGFELPGPKVVAGKKGKKEKAA